MSEETVVHNTFVIERSYKAHPERVWGALSEPEKKRRWYADAGAKGVESFEMDFRVGGWERTVSRLGPQTPFPGQPLVSEVIYHDIVEGKRVVAAQTMRIDERRISASLLTFELIFNGHGTDLVFTHQAAFFEGSDGAKMREGGWRKLFDQLAAELEN